MQGKITNNTAELTAILECLKLLKSELKYIIVSDSKYSINWVTVWYKKWEKNNWMTYTGKSVFNQKLIK